MHSLADLAAVMPEVEQPLHHARVAVPAHDVEQLSLLLDDPRDTTVEGVLSSVERRGAVGWTLPIQI